MAVDKDMAEIEYCTLKAVNRTYKYISGKLKLYKIPITKIKVHSYVLNSKKLHNSKKNFVISG